MTDVSEYLIGKAIEQERERITAALNKLIDRFPSNPFAEGFDLAIGEALHIVNDQPKHAPRFPPLVQP